MVLSFSHTYSRSFQGISISQWIAGSAVLLLYFQLGLGIGWNSPYISKLTNPASDAGIYITLEEASWITALLSVGRLVGAMSGPVLTQTCGSKTTTLITCIPSSLSWILIAIVSRDTVIMLYIARFCAGVAMGLMYVCTPIYLGEILDPKVRGMMVSAGPCGIITGCLVMVMMGPYLSLMVTSVASMMPSIILLLTFLCLPESPYFLLQMNQIEKAKRSIKYYKKNCDVDYEVNELTNFLVLNKSQGIRKTMARILETKTLRRGILLCIFLNVLIHFSGITSISLYMEIVLIRAQDTFVDPAIGVIVITILTSISACTFTMIIDKFSKRAYMLISLGGLAIGLLGLSSQFLMLDIGYDPANFQSLAFFSISLLSVSSYLGVCAIPSVVLSEIFPPDIKCTASFLANVFLCTSAFVATKLYQPSIDVFGDAYVYLIYCVFCVLSMPICYHFIPETRGKTLQEIQLDFMKSQASLP